MARDDDAQTDSFAPVKPLTPVQRRRLDSATAIANDPLSRITYQHTVLCQTCLPYRDPGDSTRVWERQQGAVFLSLEAGRLRHPKTQKFVEVGLPYGSRPRLILAHLNREALLHDSPRIEVESSLTAFIRRVLDNDSPNSREIGRFKDQLSRFAGALVRMSVDLPDDRAYQIDTKIIDSFELWVGKDERQRVLWPAVVELSPRYFESLISNHAVPLEERAISALANSPMALDVYAWLAQRLHRIPPSRPQFIAWKALQDQFGFGYDRIRAFRGHFRAVLDAVRGQYRAAKFELDERGITLRCSPPPVKGRLAIIPHPAAAIEHAAPPQEESAAAPLRRGLETGRPSLPPPPAAPGGDLVTQLRGLRRELSGETGAAPGLFGAEKPITPDSDPQLVKLKNTRVFDQFMEIWRRHFAAATAAGANTSPSEFLLSLQDEFRRLTEEAQTPD